jgi:tetraacyldisaccharide 4'-kinase
MRLIEKVWFHDHSAKLLLLPLLLPFNLIFKFLSWCRRRAYQINLFKTVKVNKPVIVVGNIGIGGNGKTPVVLWLIELSLELGLTPGVISRGYGGKAKHYPYLLTEDSIARESGDEPLMIYRRTKALVCVGSNRIKSAKLLIEQGCNIIIADDGLQHYRLARDIEMVIIDGKRRFGNDYLLPMGPLREGQWRLNTVDYLIANGGKPKNNEVPMKLVPGQFINCKTGQCLSIDDFTMLYPQINAIAAIGAPERFFDSLKHLGLLIETQQGFVDHHQFIRDDLSEYHRDIPLLMTEKDAVKCYDFAESHWWYLTVDAHIPEIIKKLIIRDIHQNIAVHN